jgi:predicted anti-sigma-YlaC factor YlaD
MNELLCDALDDYLAGDLPGNRRSEFKKHLDDCRSCRNVVDDWQRLCRTLESATRQLETPSRSLLEQIESQGPSRPPRDGLDAQKWRVAALLGTSLLAAALFTVMLRPAPRRDELAKTPEAKAPTAMALSSPPNVEFSDDVIDVPIEIGEPHVTAVWLYPTTQAAN